METRNWLSLLLLLFLQSVSASNVVDLTPENFDKVIDGSTPALVEFYAPWCGHCKSLAPIYEELADAFAHVKDKVVIAKVDADAHRDLGGKFDVKGFPTLKWFAAGVTDKPEDYQGGRELDGLAQFIQQKTGIPAKIKKTPSDVVVLDKDNFNKIALNTSRHVLVEFYAPWCGHCKNLAPIYEKVGKAFANEPSCVVAKMDATENEAVAKEYNIGGYPTIKFFAADGKEKPEDFDKGRALDDFVAYLNEKCGTHRLSDGRLSEEAGKISALTGVVKKLAKAASKDEKKKMAKELGKAGQKFLESNPLHPYAPKVISYYEKVLGKIIEKGTEYLKKESERLGRLLAKNEKEENLVPEKVDDLTLRRNVLSAYLAALKTDGHDEL